MNQSELSPYALRIGAFDRVDDADAPHSFATWMMRQRSSGADQALEALAIVPTDHVLDIGCGPGVDLAALAEVCDLAVGVDLSVIMAHIARARSSRPALVVGDAHRLPLRASSFDAAWARAVLVHAYDSAAAVAEVARVLRFGGRMVFSEPDHGSRRSRSTR